MNATKTASFLIIAALWFAGVWYAGGFVHSSMDQTAERIAAATMGDIDPYAGLSTPVRREPVTKRDVAKQCLAMNAYYEARGEGWAGQVAVGQVAMRRAGLDYNHVCKEIYKPGQFSWTDAPGQKLPAGEAWAWAQAAAEEALQWAAHPESRVDYSAKATYFHARNVTPYWSRGLELVAIIGEHRFYR